MDLTQSLFQWLKTFDLVVNCRSVNDLCDGVAIAHVLNQICPEFLNNGWLNKIETHCGTNWRLRVSNLRKIYEALDDFYREVLDKQLNEKLLPDLTLIGRDHNSEQLALLLQLILGCAINCNRKDFIERMTNLDTDVQHRIKTAIQQIDGPFDDLSIPGEPFPPASNAKESALQRCAVLEGIVNKVNNEKITLEIENQRLSEKIILLERDKYESNTNQRDSFDRESIFQGLNNQIITLQNDLSKNEEIKEDYRLSAELREEEINKLRQQLDQMVTKFKEDRDELDRLLYELDRLNEEVERYASKEVVHKKKIQEMKETKRQLQAIDERNATRIWELEEETKKLSVFKGRIDNYKKQIEELRLKVGEEGYRADRAEEETKRLTKKLEELKTQSKVIQNTKLSEKPKKSDDERVKLLESQPEDEKTRVIDLENENRLIKQKMIKLEAELKEFTDLKASVANKVEESNSFSEMEARFMTISFHNLSSQLQRKSAEDRTRNCYLNPNANSASFLGRQRQSTSRKNNLATVNQSFSDFFE